MAKRDIWKKEKTLATYVGYAIAILVLGYIAYSVWYYISTSESIEEFDVCYGDKCIKTYHIHSTLQIELCGKKINLPLEHGPLEGPHTHKERNYIHFHERLPYDSTTGKILDTRPLQIGTIMNVLDINFNERCIGDYCNGQKCPDGKIGTVRMFVNDKPNTEFGQYVWHDEDTIKITFD